MKKRKIFKNKSNFRTLNIFLSILFIFSCLILYYFYFYNNVYFFIPDNFEKNYIIPLDRGGEKVKNTDKKSLHLNHNNKDKYFFNDISTKNFSIQIFASSDYDKVKQQLNKYISKTNLIYKKEDFFTVVLNTNIGSEYLLLYKSFNNRNDAINYCDTYLFQIDNCLVVNTKIFNN